MQACLVFKRIGLFSDTSAPAMPPKTTSKAKPKTKGTFKKPGPAVPPLSTLDPQSKKSAASPYRNKDRDQIINFKEKLEEKKKEHDSQVQMNLNR